MDGARLDHLRPLPERHRRLRDHRERHQGRRQRLRRRPARLPQPWPGTNTVVTVDGTDVFGGNLSGLFYEPAAGPSSNVLWAVRNGPSTLFRLVWNGSIWTPEAANGWDTGKTLRYPNGTGSPDSEDVTKAELLSPALYVATERDNDASGVSRLSILRFDSDQPGSELTATHEWNLTADLPVVGPNLGLEAHHLDPRQLPGRARRSSTRRPATSTTRRSTPTTAPASSSSASRPAA